MTLGSKTGAAVASGGASPADVASGSDIALLLNPRSEQTALGPPPPAAGRATFFT
jgi:hypothetical protein